MGKYRRSFADRRGMTLVEMIVSLMVFSIISTGIVSMFIFTSNFYAEHQTLVAEQSALRLIMEYVTGELSLATVVVASDNALTDIPEVGPFIQFSIETVGGESRFRRQYIPSMIAQHPFTLRIEDLQMTFSPEVIDAEQVMVKVRLSSKRYTLEQDVLCRNVPLPTFTAGASQKSYISYVMPSG